MLKSDISKNLKNILYKNNNVISVSIVGSFNDNKDIKSIGDIDVVLILKKLNKRDFDACNSSILKKKKYFENKFNKKLIINNTFGPIKFDYSKFIVIHLMIYDIASHKEHVKNSPFTCYDWERSANFIGKSLNQIYPVNTLLLQDFEASRRSPYDYINDLNKNKISYRQYIFKKKSYKLVKRYFKIYAYQKLDFYKHIITNLLTNLYKFENNVNSRPSVTKEKALFLKIYKDNYLYESYIKIKNFRTSKIDLKNDSHLIKKFISLFNQYIKNLKKSNIIIFKRHNKTIFNDGSFFGQGRDASIISKIANKSLIKFNFTICYSSPLVRAIETAKIYISASKIKTNRKLSEINYGYAEGLKIKEFSKRYPKIITEWSNLKDPRFPKGENNRDVIKRARLFLNYLLRNKKNQNKNILIITHNVILRCILGFYLKIPMHDWYKIDINHKDYFQFYFQDNKILIDLSRKQIDQINKKI